MFENIETLKLIEIVDGPSALYHECRDRARHAFVFKLSGESSYDFGGHVFHLKAGEMMYVPKGATYTVKRVSTEESRFVSLNFDAEIENAVPRLYPMGNYMDIQHVCNQLVRLWLFRKPSDEYKCMSVLYDIFSKVCVADEMQYWDHKQFHQIRPAVEYLKAHIFDCSLNIGSLHLLCGISDTYFRKIFISQFGTSPQKYIINKRLTQAKSLIENGDFNSIGELALSVGYEDALYFSRGFKEKYGMPPSEAASAER